MRCTLPSLFALTLLSAAGAAVASDYIGVRQCKSCHEQAYKQWKQTPHARAAERLGPAERRDPRCTACHSTAVDDGLEGVQCEACHGPGRYYWPDAVMRDGH
ncbi:MAG: cytochrome c family protein, partial [Myxococcales bacterium]|nr:cytochrome c family protein [Myxococcales bacterium]